MNNPRFMRPGFVPPPPGGGGGGTPPAQPTGGTKDIVGNVAIRVASIAGAEEGVWTIVSSAKRVTGAGMDVPTQQRHQVMLRVTWGTSAGSTSYVFPCGKDIQLTATDVTVEALILRQDGQPVANTAKSTVTCFIGKEVRGGGALYPTKWIEPAPNGAEPSLGLNYQGQISPDPCTLFEILGQNTSGAGTLMVYDCRLADLDIHNSPIFFELTIAAGQPVSLWLPYGRRFNNGVTWVVSSTSQTVTVDNTAQWRIDAEIGGL